MGLAGCGPEQQTVCARSDRELAVAATAGDQQAWETLVDRHAQTVWSVVRNVGLEAGEAADVSLITWLRCADHIGALARSESVGDWLIATAARESGEYIGLGHTLRVVEPDDGSPDGFNGHEGRARRARSRVRIDG